MRLAEFILHNMEAILAEWEAFAATLLPAAAGMTPLALSPDTLVRVALRGEEADVRLEVTNQGPTLQPSDLSQLFDPLKRGSARGDSHDARSGQGLGLFIVREIARAHGGKVEVRSAGGETTFAVRLPRRDGARRPE